MSHPIITGFAGSLSAPSRTRAVVEDAVQLTAERYGGTGSVFDLLDLGPSLGRARRFGDLAQEAQDLLQSLVEADAIVLATPVHKGSYGGLFKHVFDLLDPTALYGKPILLAASGGGDRHALVIEHQLRPLFGFFEAQTLATGVYVSDRDFTDGRLADPAARARLERAVDQFGPYLPGFLASHSVSGAPVLAAI
ncbi:NAD(P)H-dependent oxidoreductase [Paracoccus sulfuroxidans]|uniref:FMN reductase n=1 Tax=Paracoccus sulfuroxidans TaxID=384678 RepID=A0A562NUB1_9RHOB|nr:NAD(P)H-dependent oxidoreductase [Paracoccus sulfuroxidans]TWI35782.1 FMN reductase [Paracoccus sulfuroxidans]